MQTLRALLRAEQHFDAEAFDYRFNQAPNERLFDALCAAYAATGGVAWDHDLGRMLADWRPAPQHPSLGQLIANRDVFHFQWRGAVWIPMAQFHLEDLSLNHSVRHVRRELGSNVDGWETASWFVSHNDRLAGRRPVDMMPRDMQAVLRAARADRHAALD